MPIGHRTAWDMEILAKIDLHKFALRLKVLEMLRTYAEDRMSREAGAYWRRLIAPN